MLHRLRNLTAGLARLRPTLPRQTPRTLVRKALVVATLLAIGSGAFFLGRRIGLGHVAAQSAPPSSATHGGGSLGNPYSEDYGGRVVAYIYDNVPVTRQELAEHLIARFGAERLEFLVNRVIVERACKAQGVYVTDA